MTLLHNLALPRALSSVPGRESRYKRNHLIDFLNHTASTLHCYTFLLNFFCFPQLIKSTLLLFKANLSGFQFVQIPWALLVLFCSQLPHYKSPPQNFPEILHSVYLFCPSSLFAVEIFNSVSNMSLKWLQGFLLRSVSRACLRNTMQISSFLQCFNQFCIPALKWLIIFLLFNMCRKKFQQQRPFVERQIGIIY